MLEGATFEFNRRHQRRLDMHMRINEARDGSQSCGIQFQVTRIAVAHARDDASAVDGDVRQFKFPRGQVENVGMLDDQVRLACASCGGDAFTKRHLRVVFQEIPA